MQRAEFLFYVLIFFFAAFVFLALRSSSPSSSVNGPVTKFRKINIYTFPKNAEMLRIYVSTLSP